MGEGVAESWQVSAEKDCALSASLAWHREASPPPATATLTHKEGLVGRV